MPSLAGPAVRCARSGPLCLKGPLGSPLCQTVPLGPGAAGSRCRVPVKQGVTTLRLGTSEGPGIVLLMEQAPVPHQ